MPIAPENRARYPKDWKAISLRIRNERAGNRCECIGECGTDHAAETKEHDLMPWPNDWPEAHLDPLRCWAIGGIEHPITDSRVILTVAHLPGREIEQCGDDDLKAMCQRCHLRMDHAQHKQNSAKTRHRRRALGDLFERAE